MNQLVVLISALTAFTIAAGGALGVVFVGGQPTKWQIIAAIVLGLGVAAKDTRSLLKLPPVDSQTTTSTLTETKTTSEITLTQPKDKTP